MIYFGVNIYIIIITIHGNKVIEIVLHGGPS